MIGTKLGSKYTFRVVHSAKFLKRLLSDKDGKDKVLENIGPKTRKPSHTENVNIMTLVQSETGSCSLQNSIDLLPDTVGMRAITDGSIGNVLLQCNVNKNDDKDAAKKQQRTQSERKLSTCHDKDDKKSKGSDSKSGDSGICGPHYGSPSGSSSHPIGKKGRSNYVDAVEQAMNCQILAELSAAYAYMSMASYFGNVEVSLPGLAKFYWEMHEEEIGHAKMFIDFQNLRGGRVKLAPIAAPEVDDWGCVTKVLEVSLEMEKLIKNKLVDLHALAEKHKDVSLSEFVSGNFFLEQDRSINEFASLLVTATKFGTCPCTEHLFDREIMTNYVKKK